MGLAPFQKLHLQKQMVGQIRSPCYCLLILGLEGCGLEGGVGGGGRGWGSVDGGEDEFREQSR